MILCQPAASQLNPTNRRTMSQTGAMRVSEKRERANRGGGGAGGGRGRDGRDALPEGEHAGAVDDVVRLCARVDDLVPAGVEPAESDEQADHEPDRRHARVREEEARERRVCDDGVLADDSGLHVNLLIFLIATRSPCLVRMSRGCRYTRRWR